MTAILKHVGYCGMATIRETYDTLPEARKAAADSLRYFRKRFPVQIVKRGIEWEILEPDNAAMVPDSCGLLFISRITYECLECGSEYDSKEDRDRCCSVFEFIDDSEEE